MGSFNHRVCQTFKHVCLITYKHRDCGDMQYMPCINMYMFNYYVPKLCFIKSF